MLGKKFKFITSIGVFLIISIFLYGGVIYALNLSRVKEWSAEILTYADLNAEFDNILDHAIANADISATAAVVASKIDFTTASAIGSTTPSTGAFTTLSSTGNTTIGNAVADTLHINSNAITLEGHALDAHEVTILTTTLTADKTITLPNADMNFVTGLGVANGGIGAATLADGYVLLGSGTSAITPLDVRTDGAIIIGDGTTDPTTLSAFDSSTGTLKVANGGTAATTLAGAFICQAVQLSYTGSGADSRNLTGAGFNPNFAIIVNTGAPDLNVTFKSFSTDGTDLSNNYNSSNADWIQDFITDGIQLGTNVNVNTSGATYDVLLLLTATGAAAG